MSPPAQTPPRVLLVEDEPSLLMLFDRVLRRLGFEAALTSCGADAAEQLSHEPFDLLLTDKNIFAPDGCELARRARQLRPRMGILLMTGYPSLSSVKELVGVVDAYLVKPVDVTRLSSTLHYALEVRSILPPPKPAVGSGALVLDTDTRRAARWAEQLTALGLYAETGADLAAIERVPGLEWVVVSAACVAKLGAEDLTKARLRRGAKLILHSDKNESLACWLAAVHLRADAVVHEAATADVLPQALRVRPAATYASAGA